MNQFASPRLVQVFPFEYEQREATRLGFDLSIMIDDDEHVVACRLEARNDRTLEAVRKAAEDDRATGIEAACTFTVLDSRMDKLRDAIHKALDEARQVV